MLLKIKPEEVWMTTAIYVMHTLFLKKEILLSVSTVKPLYFIPETCCTRKMDTGLCVANIPNGLGAGKRAQMFQALPFPL